MYSRGSQGRLAQNWVPTRDVSTDMACQRQAQDLGASKFADGSRGREDPRFSFNINFFLSSSSRLRSSSFSR